MKRRHFGGRQRSGRAASARGQSLTIVLAILALITAAALGWRITSTWFATTPTPAEHAAAFRARSGAAAERGADAALAAASTRGAGTPLFEDAAPALGIEFHHDSATRGNYLLPEQLGPGCAFIDYDDDRDLDAFVAGGGAIIDDGPPQTCRLFRNDGDRFADVTVASGIAAVAGPAYGVACADYDNDGDVDIFIGRLGANELLRNNADGTFTAVGASAGLADASFSMSAVFFDYDRDGWLDLYVANYVDWSAAAEEACFSIQGTRDYCSPTTYERPSRDLLYRNRGDGGFENVSQRAGIASERGNGLGVVAADFDDDGWIDLYVANDQSPAFLWKNRRDGTFENIAPIAGCAYDGRGVAIAGMGVACEDIDGDRDLDLLVTNIRDQYHLVLENDRGYFEDRSLDRGMSPWSIPATGFGVALFDQNNDGELDAFIANGDVNLGGSAPESDNPYAQPNHFLRLINGRFVDASAESGAAFAEVSRAVAAGDFDNDGDLDLLVTNCGGPLRLLRNDNRDGGSWLMIDARTGGASQRQAIGARISIEACGRIRVRDVRPQQSYLASGDGRVHVGLGACAGPATITIRWPDGAQSVHEGIELNQTWRIVQPSPAENSHG